MKIGEIRKIAEVYSDLFPSEWKPNRTEFVRCVDSWVQIVDFHPSQFDKKYIPKCCFEFLKMPGASTGTFLVQELLHKKHRVQRWITMDEHSKSSSSIFAEMVAQFKPSIVEPLKIENVQKLLHTDLDYWPHPYALCVMAVEKANRRNATTYFEMFSKAISGKPYHWAENRRKELTRCLDLIDSPDQLKAYLNPVQKEKLTDFRALLQ